MEFEAVNGKYVIEDGFIKWFDKKGKLQEVIFIDRINWIWLLGDANKILLLGNIVQIHMNDKELDLYAKEFDQAKQMLDAILEEKRKLNSND